MTNQSHAMHLMILDITERHGITNIYKEMDTETRKHLFQFVTSITVSQSMQFGQSTQLDETLLIAYIVGYDRGRNYTEFKSIYKGEK